MSRSEEKERTFLERFHYVLPWGNIVRFEHPDREKRTCEIPAVLEVEVSDWRPCQRADITCGSAVEWGEG